MKLMSAQLVKESLTVADRTFSGLSSILYKLLYKRCPTCGEEKSDFPHEDDNITFLDHDYGNVDTLADFEGMCFECMLVELRERFYHRGVFNPPAWSSAFGLRMLVVTVCRDMPNAEECFEGRWPMNKFIGGMELTECYHMVKQHVVYDISGECFHITLSYYR